MKAFKIIGVIAVVVALIWLGVASHKETEKQRTIVNEVRSLIDECKKIGDAPISVRGKYLVWDVTKDSRSAAHGKLSREIRASSSDSQITVFMVLPERNVMVGRYSISHEPAYRQYMDVCVTYWPEKKAVGMHSVVSKKPRSSRPVQQSPEYGDPNEPIVRWINSLPRTIFWVCGGDKSSDGNKLDGKWRGTITEKGTSTNVELKLREQQSTIEGTFTILGETGQDVDKGMVFPIAQAERSGNNLRFIVPVSGKVDDDAIAFELLIEGNSLMGHGHELRKGSDNLSITFTKQE